MEVSGQLHAPAALPQGKSPRYPLDRRLGGPQSRSGRGGEEKNSQPPQGIELQNPDRPAHSPALYGLSYHSSLRLHGVLLFKLRDICTFYLLRFTKKFHQISWLQVKAKLSLRF
jgi:hypothetical protein